jgi:hypothetical protein
MSTKFLQALARMKPASPQQVKAAMMRLRTGPRGVAAYDADLVPSETVRRYAVKPGKVAG